MERKVQTKVSQATILTVDDDPSTVAVLSSVLQERGNYKVVTATNVADAIVIAERHMPDLILTDRYMPGRDGFDFCSWVKAHPVLSGSMVMLLTASAEIESIVKGLAIGADDYLTKPFNSEELLSRVRALLRIKRLSDQVKADKERLERLNTVLHDDLSGVTHLITHIIELRVPNALLRAERACALAEWLAEKMEVPPEAMSAIMIAARIHEVGKIVMPERTFGHNVAGIASEDREALHQFPAYGHMLVARIPQLTDVATIIKHQLENFDGTGGPDHLRGKQIPLGARILRVVNAMEQLSFDAAPFHIGEELERQRGTILDPFLVQSAVEYVTTLSDPAWMQGKKQVAIGKIEEGMVTASDICTSKGIKLLPRGTKLSQSHIAWIQTHHQKDPILSGIYVYDTSEEVA